VNRIGTTSRPCTRARSTCKGESASETIGFIGLGIMGKPMARNLMKAGYDLVVLDVDPRAADELVVVGAAAAGSPAEVTARARRIFTMLPNGSAVEEVVTGPQGVLSAASADTVLVDMSSVSPETARSIAAALAARGARCLDAPVSGGEPGAVSGELVIMVGGPTDVFAETKPLFDVLGKSAVLVGAHGSGQIAKLVNQLLVATHLEAMAEGLLLAVRAGVDPRLVLDAIRGGLADSNVLSAKAPMLLARNFTPGARISLHSKDLKNVLATAHGLGLSLPVAEIIDGMFDSLIAEGKGGLDHAALAQAVETLNGIEIRMPTSK
jgi:2-hydroxy-3-oxopropionate reductase